MVYQLQAVNDFVCEWDVEFLNILYDYKLEETFNKDVKKIFMHLFIRELNKKLSNSNFYLYYNPELCDNCGFKDMYPKFKAFLEKLCVKMGKMTNRVIKLNLPVPESSVEFNKLDGEIQDTLLLAGQPPNVKLLRKFLKTHSMKDLYKNLHYPSATVSKPATYYVPKERLSYQNVIHD